MFRWPIGLVIALSTLMAGPTRAQEAPKTGAKTVRLMCVGNSFSNNATQYLGDLVKAAGHTLTYQPMAIGGASFTTHWTRIEKNEADPKDPLGLYGKKSLREELAAQPWDIITIQQASIRSHDPATYQPDAGKLFAYIKKHSPKSEIVIHQTWAYRVDDPRFNKKETPKGEPANQREMYEGLTKTYDAIAAELKVRVIPVGDAFYLADTDPKWGYQPDKKFDFAKAAKPTLPDQTHSLHVGWSWKTGKDSKESLGIDGHHASPAGQYLAACVWLEFLYGESPVGNKFIPAKMDPEYAKFLQETAHKAIVNRNKK